jgi:hypothetical protein
LEAVLFFEAFEVANSRVIVGTKPLTPVSRCADGTRDEPDHVVVIKYVPHVGDRYDYPGCDPWLKREDAGPTFLLKSFRIT